MRSQRQLHLFGRYGVTVFAISGVDIALWDLAAKRAGLPLHRLLSAGEARTTIPFYANLYRYGEAALATSDCEAALRSGFTAVKLHEIELTEIDACGSALGSGNQLCVDVNCQWSVDFVRDNCAHLERLELAWIEEPIFPPEDFLSLKELRGKPSSIAAGENWSTARQCREALTVGAVDIVQPSITKVGGVSEYLEVISAAEAAGVSVMPHSPYFGPGFFAGLQVACARPTVKALEYNFVRPDAWLADVEGLRHGDKIAVSEAPGIGFEPDLNVMRRYRRA